MTIDLHNPSDEMIEAVAKVVRAEVVASQRPDASLGTRGFEERVAAAAIAALAGMTPPVPEVSVSGEEDTYHGHPHSLVDAVTNIIHNQSYGHDYDPSFVAVEVLDYVRFAAASQDGDS